jgi:uncharacterized protein YkwD
MSTRLRFLSLTAAVAAALLLAPTAASPAIAAPSQAEVDAARSRILADTNRERTGAGLAPLAALGGLDSVAQACAERQAAADAIFHCTPEAYNAYPAGWTRAAENVAMGYTPSSVVPGWMNSPGHRANILQPQHTHIGIGYAISRTGRTYFAQNFAAYTFTTGFADVGPSYSFAREIAWMNDRAISTGYAGANGAREYRPWAPVTRDAMAAFLYRYAGSPAFTPPRVSPFADVASTDPFYREISWLRAEGISTGWNGENGLEFRPLQPITRDAMAAFLFRLEKVGAYTPRSGFADVPGDSPFHREIGWLADNGISTGWPVGGVREFRPFQPITRDAMAAFLYRLSS